MSLPATMRAVLVREHGAVDRLEFAEVPVPPVGPADALVRIHVTGVNHLDLWVRRGVDTHKFPLPLIPGNDVAGEIAALGSSVQGRTAGERVTLCPTLADLTCEECLRGEHQLCRAFGVLGETRDGGYAEYVVVPAVNLLRLPESMRFEEAAALPLVGLTAHHMLFHRARLQPGETVLIQAAGSGVGSMAIQLARMIGARIIATASTEAKCAKALELGADHAVDYTQEDWGKQVYALTGKTGVDVVFENVGRTTWAGSLRALKKGGRLVTCGATSGAIVESDLRLIFFKSLSILGSTMGGIGEMQQVWRLATQGRIRPVIDRTFPMREVRAAHTYLENRQQFGKVLLTQEWPT